MTPSDPTDPAHPAAPTDAPAPDAAPAPVVTSTGAAPAPVTEPGAAHPAAPAGDAVRVVGPAAVLEVCLRAAVLLLGLAVIGLVVAGVGAAVDGSSTEGFQTTALILGLMYVVHLVALAVLGWPGGLLTAHLVRNEPSERRQVLAFAIAGAVLGAASTALWIAEAAIVWFFVGGLTAGAARWWTGRARRRRARLRAVHPSEL